jgi:hypothetical protein
MNACVMSFHFFSIKVLLVVPWAKLANKPILGAFVAGKVNTPAILVIGLPI